MVLLITWHEPVCLETVDGGWAIWDSLEAHCLDNAILDDFSLFFLDILLSLAWLPV
jgi:hypothetical protein